MQTFQELTTARRIDEGTFTWDVPDGWQQGRGAFGGLVIATLVRAMEDALAAPDRPLRTLTATLAGPVDAGDARVVVDVLRAGSGLSAVAARVVQGDVRAHAVGVFGRERSFEGWRPTRPALGDWRDAPEVALGPPLAPVFAPHFEFRPTEGVPFTAAPEARTAGWVRLREQAPRRDAAWIAAMADAWWPALLPRLTAPRPAGTVSYTLEIFDDLKGLDAASPLYHSGVSPVASAGYPVEFRELWGEDGRLVAMNQQTFAVIR